MKQSKAPKPTLSPKPQPDTPAGPGSMFIGMAVDMTWRLAIVVLVPIVGGFELDKKFNTTPALTIVGFILAIIGMTLVLMRMLKVASKIPIPPSEEKQ
jgi:F0F1-type ATP synthase assembly protein I